MAKFHGGVVPLEQAAKGQSQPNGAVEGAVRLVQEFARVLKLQIEDQAQTELKPDDAILPWLIRWAAIMPSRCLVEKTGKTAYERPRGRSCNMQTLPFGENIWYKEMRETHKIKYKFTSE